MENSLNVEHKPKSILEHLGTYATGDLALLKHQCEAVNAFVEYLKERPNASVPEIVRSLGGVM